MAKELPRPVKVEDKDKRAVDLAHTLIQSNSEYQTVYIELIKEFRKNNRLSEEQLKQKAGRTLGKKQLQDEKLNQKKLINDLAEKRRKDREDLRKRKDEAKAPKSGFSKLAGSLFSPVTDSFKKITDPLRKIRDHFTELSDFKQAKDEAKYLKMLEGQKTEAPTKVEAESEEVQTKSIEPEKVKEALKPVEPQAEADGTMLIKELGTEPQSISPERNALLRYGGVQGAAAVFLSEALGSGSEEEEEDKGILGGLLDGVGGLGLFGATGLFAKFGSGLAGLISAIGWPGVGAIAAIGLLVLAADQLYQAWQRHKEWFDERIAESDELRRERAIEIAGGQAKFDELVAGSPRLQNELQRILNLQFGGDISKTQEAYDLMIELNPNILEETEDLIAGTLSGSVGSGVNEAGIWDSYDEAQRVSAIEEQIARFEDTGEVENAEIIQNAYNTAKVFGETRTLEEFTRDQLQNQLAAAQEAFRVAQEEAIRERAYATGSGLEGFVGKARGNFQTRPEQSVEDINATLQAGWFSLFEGHVSDFNESHKGAKLAPNEAAYYLNQELLDQFREEGYPEQVLNTIKYRHGMVAPDAQQVNDAIITSDGQVIHTHEDDNIIATKNEPRFITEGTTEFEKEANQIDQTIQANLSSPVMEAGITELVQVVRMMSSEIVNLKKELGKQQTVVSAPTVINGIHSSKNILETMS